MQQTFKNEMFESFLVELGTIKVELSDVQKRRIADALTNKSMDLLILNGKYLREIVKNAVMEREYCLSEFKDFIDQIVDRSKKVHDAMMVQGMVFIDTDKTSGKQILKARSSVLQESVDFLNYLNKKVVVYYRDVFRMDMIKK